MCACARECIRGRGNDRMKYVNHYSILLRGVVAVHAERFQSHTCTMH